MTRAGALRHRGFRLLVAGQLSSNVGDALYAVALPWYVLANHGGALLLAVVLAAYGVPRTAVMALGGQASDRWGPWTAMLVADVIRGVSVVALALTVLAGPAHAAVLVPIAALIGAGEGLFLPASMSIIPALLPDDDLQAGNALSMGGAQLAMLIGPAVGGALVAAAGSAPAFFVDGGSFALSALTLVRIRLLRSMATRAVNPVEHAAPQTGTASTTVWQLIRGERVLQVILVVTLAANLGSGAVSEVALPALAHGPLHAGASGYGGLIAAFAGGALLGTLFAGTRHVDRPALIASGAFLTEGLVMSLIPYLGGALPAGAALAAFGVLNGFGNVLTLTAFQRWAPPAMLGRLMGVLMLSSMGMFPVSVLLGGVLVRGFGPSVVFPLAGAVLAAAVLAGLTQPTWRQFGVRAQPEAAPTVLA